MNYGFHLATAGAITGMRRLDTVANNLANATTVGFKADMLMLSARKPENLEQAGAVPDANALLDGLGGGSLFHPNAIDLSQGALRQTGQAFDVALDGDGFLVLAQPKGAASTDLLLTRAGALTRRADGVLVLATSGTPVLDEDGRQIRLDGESAPRFESDGRVIQDGTEVGRLRIVVPTDVAQLAKEGRDALRLRGGAVRNAPESTQLVQGALEESTVDPVAALAEMVRVSRGVEFSTRLMQMQDQMTGRLVDTFGRFA